MGGMSVAEACRARRQFLEREIELSCMIRRVRSFAWDGKGLADRGGIP